MIKFYNTLRPVVEFPSLEITHAHALTWTRHSRSERTQHQI